MSSQWQHAVDVGRRLGHDKVSGIYYEELGHPGSFALGCLMIIIVFVTLGVNVYFNNSQIDLPLGVGLIVLLLIQGLPLVAIVFCIRASTQLHRRSWTYLYPGGLVTIDPKGKLTRQVLWRDVCGAGISWSQSESGGASITGCRLRMADGTSIVFDWHIRNALDPLRTLHVITSAKPLPQGEPLRKFPTLLEALDELLVRPLAQQIVDRCAAGESFDFGRLIVSESGVVYKKKPMLRWDEMSRVKIEDDGQMQLWRHHDKRRYLNVSLYEIPDDWLLTRVIAQRTNLSAG